MYGGLILVNRITSVTATAPGQIIYHECVLYGDSSPVSDVSALLSARQKPASADTAGTESGPNLPRPPATPEESLTDLITSYLPDGVPRVEEAAEISGMTVRTFQRRLAARSLNGKSLASNVHFERARTQLEQPDLPVVEVSMQLGYRNSAHFTRAFRQMPRMSPRQYRSR
jgi:AraC-like DNA-binding protein